MRNEGENKKDENEMREQKANVESRKGHIRAEDKRKAYNEEAREKA